MIRVITLLFLSLISPLLAQASTGEKIVAAARSQIGVTLFYDPAYTSLPYPNCDVPRNKGVCTDVLIRALRDGLSCDLQKLVHEDMSANFSAYPKQWGLSRPDKNIDHRRVPNLRTWFTRKKLEIQLPKTPSDISTFLPGDIVTCTVPPHLPHVMIISDKKTTDGRPFVIHNIGNGTREEDRLNDFPLTGHYRWK